MLRSCGFCGHCLQRDSQHHRELLAHRSQRHPQVLIAAYGPCSVASCRVPCRPGQAGWPDAHRAAPTARPRSMLIGMLVGWAGNYVFGTPKHLRRHIVVASGFGTRGKLVPAGSLHSGTTLCSLPGTSACCRMGPRAAHRHPFTHTLPTLLPSAALLVCTGNVQSLPMMIVTSVCNSESLPFWKALGSQCAATGNAYVSVGLAVISLFNCEPRPPGLRAWGAERLRQRALHIAGWCARLHRECQASDMGATAAPDCLQTLWPMGSSESGPMPAAMSAASHLAPAAKATRSARTQGWAQQDVVLARHKRQQAVPWPSPLLVRPSCMPWRAAPAARLSAGCSHSAAAAPLRGRPALAAQSAPYPQQQSRGRSSPASRSCRRRVPLHPETGSSGRRQRRGW